MAARLYADENFPLPVVENLRLLGYDVVTMQEEGLGGQAISDPEVLERAIAAQRALMTLNRRDFIRLHADRPDHFGLIVCTVDPDYPGLCQRIHDAITSSTELRGQILRINRPNR